MARSWKDIRTEVEEAGLVDPQRVANATKAMREEIRAYKLVDMRRMQGMTQAALAATMHVAQPRVSAIERGQIERAELGTLQAYVEGLGGKLRIVADFGDEVLTVRD